VEQLTHVSRSAERPREALRLLAEQGPVEHLPGSGRLTAHWVRDLDELFAVRDALERFAVSLVRHRKPDELDTAPLEEAMTGLRTAAEQVDRLARATRIARSIWRWSLWRTAASCS
jgi:DNA-binding GntR family transcriptional regulator